MIDNKRSFCLYDDVGDCHLSLNILAENFHLVSDL